MDFLKSLTVSIGTTRYSFIDSTECYMVTLVSGQAFQNGFIHFNVHGENLNVFVAETDKTWTLLKLHIQ